MLIIFSAVSGAKLEGGRGGEVSLAFFQKLEKIALICAKKCPDCGHLWVNFLFKIHFFLVL